MSNWDSAGNVLKSVGLDKRMTAHAKKEGLDVRGNPKVKRTGPQKAAWDIFSREVEKLKKESRKSLSDNWSDASDILKAEVRDVSRSRKIEEVKDSPKSESAVAKKVAEEFAKFKKKGRTSTKTTFEGGQLRLRTGTHGVKKINREGGAQRFTLESLLKDYLSSKGGASNVGWRKFTKQGREALEDYKEAQRNAPTMREVVEGG